MKRDVLQELVPTLQLAFKSGLEHFGLAVENEISKVRRRVEPREEDVAVRRRAVQVQTPPTATDQGRRGRGVQRDLRGLRRRQRESGGRRVGAGRA